MGSASKIVRVALCGPSDVRREIDLAKNAIEEWNLKHSDALGVNVRASHWQTDSSPDLSARSQGIINRQLIDDSDIVVAIFWYRFGSPTGFSDSGTEEEIRRGIVLDKRVMVYFSKLEPIPPSAELLQLEQLQKFKQFLQPLGLYWDFSSRRQFRTDFDRHLARAIHELHRMDAEATDNIRGQVIHGDGNIQVGGSITFFNQPPSVKTVLERREGSISAEQQQYIHTLIEELSESTLGKTRKEAFAEWWSRFHKRFKVSKVEDLPGNSMAEVQSWHKQQRGIQIKGAKSKAPDDWRRSRISAIKAAMKSMGVTNEEYYAKVASRLKMKNPFQSLNDLTKKDLERVYSMARRDSEKR